MSSSSHNDYKMEGYPFKLERPPEKRIIKIQRKRKI